MKKRFLLLLGLLVILVGCLAIHSMAATTKTGYCQACQKDVTWQPIVFGTQTGSEGEHRHYYLDKDYTHTTMQQLQVKGNNMTLCVDLNGKSWYSYGRAFYANYNTKNEDYSTINIQDSAGGAVVTSRAEAWLKADGTVTGTNNTGGANIWVAEKCIVNIYGGTFKLDAVQSEQGLRVDNGGIASVCEGGVLNVYGGTLQGGNIKASGAAVYLYAGGKLNAYGGRIKSGNSANSTGSCVGLRPGTGNTVTLSGNAQIDDIWFPELKIANLAVSGSFTGKANLTYKSDVTLAVGTAVGTLVNSGSITDADIYCTNGIGYAVVADGTSLKLAAPSTEDMRYECPHCKTSVKWEAFPNAAPTAAGSYHYYLHKDFGQSEAKQFTVKEGIQVCIDLHGHNFSTIGRAFGTSGSGATLSIIDTEGDGSINATASGNNPGGGCVSVGGSTTFNLYGGTLSFTHDPAAKWGGTGRGGVIQNSGTSNIYGGKIVGGQVVDCTYEFTGIEGAGGAIYSSSTLNILGGEITSGSCPESGAGPCIYVAGTSCKVTLGGNAKVEDLYFSDHNPAQLTVTGTYTGTANIAYAPSVTPTERMVIGTLATGADISDARISCSSYFVLPSETQLILSSYSGDTVAATGGVGYNSLQAAINACQDGYVELLHNVNDDISVPKSLHLQLNGCSIKGTVTVAEGCTLYVMDSATDDYTVKDGKYGKLTKVVGNVAGAVIDGGIAQNNYLQVAEADGISFHCVTMQIYAMTLRVDTTDDKQEPGIFYKSRFRADEKAAPMIASYGVALSLAGEPTIDNLEIACCYTEFTGFESGLLGNLGNTSSSLLTGILKNRYSQQVNLQNANLPVYGRTYIKTADGQMLFGATVCRSLVQQLENIDQILPTLSATQVSAVVNMYTQFQSVLETASLPGIVEAVETEEEGTLKVLVLGNSHGLDATNLLYEVFHNEAPEQKVIIAALYYSGCRVDQHHTYLEGNQKVYTYHKNDGTQPNRAWVVKDATCLDALEDEQWDVILMQQMNTNAATEANYNASDWKFVADYLLNNQDNTPILGFHMTWANPDDYELYLNDNAPYKISTGATGVTNWRNNHQNKFPDPETGLYEQDIMYAEIMRLTQKYLVDSTDWLGKDYFDERYIMNSATPVHYAQNVLGRTHEHIYRDYTHMNDYGRLICAYQWYAQLMGLEEITEVNTDVIPSVLKHKNSKYPSATDANGDYIVDDQMKADLIASVNWALKNPFNLPTE